MANYGQALKDSKDGNWEKVVENLDIEESWRYPVSVGICETDEFKEVVTKRDDSRVFKELNDQLIKLVGNALDGLCTPRIGEQAVQILREQPYNDWNHHCTVRLPYEKEGKKKTYIWGIYQKRGAAECAIVLESTYWKALRLYETKEWDELANALHIANEWRDKVKEWFENGSNTFKQALVYMEKREAEGQQIYTKAREIFSPLREIKFAAVGDSERDDQDLRIAASIILHDQKGEDDRLNVHVWSLDVSRTDSFSDNTALEDGQLKSDGSELMYSTALKFYKEQHWAGLRNLFDIKRRGWNSVLQEIWQSESFREVIEKRDGSSVFEELNKQLTGRVPNTSDALYTGEQAVQILREQSFNDWNHHCTVRLSCEIEGENRTYIWGLYQKRGAAEYAIVLESTYWKALQLYKQCTWDELVNALDIANEWRDKVKEWFENGSNTFKQVLEYMARREAEGPQIYTKVKEIFSQLREIKSTESAASEGDLEMIATIILNCYKGTDNQFKVHYWSLKGSRTAPTDSFRAKEVFKDGGLDPEKSELVYSTALRFYNEEYWAGLRNLFDIDQTWWDTVLRKILGSITFERVLTYLKGKEEIGEAINPQFNNIFSWTRVPECKPENVEVIIAGHDPVADPKATGISFLIKGEKEKQHAITNLFKSVAANYDFDPEEVTHRCPYSWCEQGVLLLNRFMTIGPDEQSKHHGCGWGVITTNIVMYFVNRSKYILLWGHHWKSGAESNPFQRLKKMVKNDQTKVIHNAHPSNYKDEFYKETAVDGRLFDDLREIIRWDTIGNGYPEIPPGVIHLEIGPEVIHDNQSSLEQQMAAIDLQKCANAKASTKTGDKNLEAKNSSERKTRKHKVMKNQAK